MPSRLIARGGLYPRNRRSEAWRVSPPPYWGRTSETWRCLAGPSRSGAQSQQGRDFPKDDEQSDRPHSPHPFLRGEGELMDSARLIYMANQIARNFAVQGDEEAVAATTDHLVKFWDPRMKAQLLASDGEGLSPIAAKAAHALREVRSS